MDSRETQSLTEIWRKGGKAPISAVARAMRISSDYGRIILLDVGKKDYIDITRGGMCRITKKGKELLENRGILAKIAQEEKERKGAKTKAEEKGKPKVITLDY